MIRCYEEVKMSKKIYARLVAGLMCAALLFTDAVSLDVWAVSNNPSADEIASLAEPGKESDTSVISEEGNDIKETEASPEKESEEGTPESSDTEETDGEETENPSGEEPETETPDGESEAEDPDGEEQEAENPDAEDKDEIGEPAEAGDTLLSNDVFAADNIAGGVSNNITWSIDSKGKLTVTGAGDWKRNNDVQGYAPWYDHNWYIRSAVVDVRDTTDASHMFDGCILLETIDLSKFDTSKVTDMSYMFHNCANVKTLNIKGLDTSQVTNMEWMFAGYKNPNYGYNQSCHLDLSGFDTRNVTDMSYMFSGCAVNSLNVSSFDTSQVMNMENMFGGCPFLKQLDLRNFRTGNVTNMKNMFNGCSELDVLLLDNFDTGKVTDMSWMFSGCYHLTSLDLKHFCTDNLKSMSFMFHNCYWLKSLDVSSFNTSNIGSMQSMFQNCESLTSLDLSSFDTSKVSEMSNMFSSCKNLTSLNVSSFDTSHVMGMEGVFKACSSLASLDVSSFDTSQVETMKGMFESCNNLKELDVSGFDISSVKNLQDMFNGCNSLKSLDLSSFDASRVSDASGMVYAWSLESIYTPRNLNCYVRLPIDTYKNSNDKWYRAGGEEIEILPQNEKDSILVMRYKAPDVSEPRISAVKKKTAYICDETVMDNDITVTYYTDKGTVEKITEGFTTNVTEINKTMSTPGKKTLTVSYQPDAGGELTAEIELTVTLGLTQENTVITLPDIQAGDNPVYNSRQHTPRVEVKLSQGDKVLDTRTDYTVSYKNNIHAGEAAVDVTGMGIYSGTVTKTFTIAKAPLTLRVKDTNLAQGDPVPETFAYETEGLADADRGKSIQTSFTFKDKDGNPVARENVDTGEVTSETGIFYYVIPYEADAGTDYDVNKGAQEEAIRGKLTITAERIVYTVTFDMAGHGENTKIREIKAGSLIKEPTAPTAEGYLFTGWYKDIACSKAWDFAVDTVLSDTTLYARWVVQTAKGGIQIQEIPDQSYTGNAIKPVLAVYASDGTLLKAGKDYTVKYEKNINADQKTADGGTYNSLDGKESGFDADLPYVEIKGKGNHTGTVYRNFHIRKASIGDGSNAAAGFALKYADQLVTNAKSVQKPFSSLKYKKAMTAGKDYTVTYSSDNVLDADGNAVKAEDGGKWTLTGTYDQSKNNKYTLPAIPKGYSGVFEMTVEGIGNYEGAIKREIYVTDKANLIKNVTVTLGKNQKNMPYSESRAVTLTPGYSDGKKYYKVSADGTVSSTPEANANDLFTVKSGKVFLVWGQDYTVTYTNNRAVGTATMTITGIGDYKGSKSAAFKITGAAFKANTIEVKAYDQNSPNENDFKASMPYTGSAITQNKVTLTTKVTKTNPVAKTLRYGEHYTISYKNNIRKGTATMTFTAKPESGYSGSFKKTFKIGAVSLADPAFVKAETAESTGQEPDSLTSEKDDKGNTFYKLNGTVTYTREGAKPSQRIRLTLCDGKGNPTDVVLKEGTDYTVSYANNTVLKSANLANKIPTMTFKGKGNYAGNLKVTFDISEAAMEAGADKLTVSAAATAYDSKKASEYQYAPKVTVKDGKKALGKKDYTVQYEKCTQTDVEAYLTALEDSNATWETVQAKRPYAVIKALAGSGYTTEAGKEIKVYLDFYRTKLTGGNLYIIVSEGENLNIYSGQQVMPSQVTVYYSADTKAIAAAKKAKETDEGALTSASGTYKLTRLTPQTESNGAGDYTLTYGVNVTAGKNKGSVTVTGTGMYGGSVTAKFTILQRDVYTAP